MNSDIVNGRMERELRRRHLAMRLIRYQARTQTIEELTGLTRHQLATLRRRVGVSTESRFRGPAPTSFEVFFSSARTRNEGAVLALLYRAFGASKYSNRVNGASAAIERGERLCDIYEIQRHLFPRLRLEFEQLALLGEGVNRRDQITFGKCVNCHAIILLDLLAAQRKQCSYCGRAQRRDSPPTSNLAKQKEDEEMDLALYQLQLIGGKLLHERNGSYAFEDDGSV